MKTVIHKSEDRGISELGWLHSRFSFSFANYYNPEKINFGKLRVLNDDIVEPGKGFGTHPHDNMEIISIVLQGALQHRDSMGSGSVIKEGDVQVMSAGSGIQHSEFNPSNEEKVNFLQIWIFPKEKNIKPRYDQKYFPLSDRKNQIKTVVSGIVNNDTLQINQGASISLGSFDAEKNISYKMHKENNGAYLFILKGGVNFDGEKLSQRDAIGIYDTNEFSFNTEKDSDFIIIEVPLN